VAPTADVPTAMAATEMRTPTVTTAAMTTATVTTAAVATTTFGSGISSGRQHGRENNDGKPDIEFRHGTGTGTSRIRGDIRKTQAGRNGSLAVAAKLGNPSGAGQGALPRSGLETVIASESEAIHHASGKMDCFVASLLAMTTNTA
jgi:hypothetical protein